MSLRRSTRVPKPKVAWEAEDTVSIASHTKISARNLQTTQKNAFKSVTLDLVSETVESNENAPSHGEQDLRPSIATWKAKEAPSAAFDPKITKKKRSNSAENCTITHHCWSSSKGC